MCLNGTYPFLSATLVRQLPYYLFRETCFMDSALRRLLFTRYAPMSSRTKNADARNITTSAQSAAGIV